MKHIIILIALSLLGVNSYSQNPDKIIGKYHLPNKLDVEIYKVEKNKYNGKIIALNGFEDGQTTDINNSEESKQKNRLIGMEIIKGLSFDSDDKQWVDGEMYGPEKGMTFNLKITEMRENEIEVVGSKFFLWHTLVWKKI
jgi:uncharacterized protein (DUF2147 family)